MHAVTLVVPTYDEAENVLSLLERVRAAMRDWPLDIAVVDDDSPDGTWRLAEEYGRRHPEVGVIRRVGQRGLSAAVLEGFRRARGDLLAVMDADLSWSVTTSSSTTFSRRMGPSGPSTRGGGVPPRRPTRPEA